MEKLQQLGDVGKTHKYAHQFITAISFGLTSGVISSLGMIVGLNSATSSKLVVIAGIVLLSIADGLADSAGMHLSEESEVEGGKSKHTSKEVWLTTIFTFVSVVGIAISFVIPILLFDLGTAILIVIGWGFLLLILLNYYIAKIKNEKPLKLIVEHLLLAVAIILVADWLGTLLAITVG
jgi:VIT1/CCC1 family predicted Fe2+/Mn2+ transporter